MSVPGLKFADSQTVSVSLVGEKERVMKFALMCHHRTTFELSSRVKL